MEYLPIKEKYYEFIASIAHEVNREYCLALDDTSQTSWEEAPQWQKDSAIAGVKFHLDNKNAGPEAFHNSWVKQKLEEGWKYGEVKDPEKKEHPCIVPFEKLPKEQQAKDFIFRGIIHAVHKAVFDILKKGN